MPLGGAGAGTMGGADSGEAMPAAGVKRSCGNVARHGVISKCVASAADGQHTHAM